MAAKNNELVIEIVSDFVCPWCYIGDVRVEEALRRAAPEAEVNFRWLPFELNAAMPAEGADREEYMSRKFGGREKFKEIETRMTAVAAEDGLEFRQDLIKKSPNTFKAHRLSWLAAREGKASGLARLMFAAYFSEGKDIGDDETLANIAAQAGMDAKKVKTFLQSSEGAAEVKKLEEASRERGVRMVPHIKIGDEEMSGAHPAEEIAKVIKRALGNRQAA